MMRPSIALIAASLDTLGGQGIQARALVGRLRADGYAVTFIAVNPRFPALIGWLRRFRYLRTIVNEVLYLSSLTRLRTADIVHVFSASYWSFMLAPVPAILAARALRKRIVLHYHSGEAADHLDRWGRIIAPFLRLVDEIVVPSTYLQSVFASHGYSARVIPNIVETSDFRYRERSRLRPALLSARNLESYYRVDNTVAAFAILKKCFPDATLVIAGHGSEEPQVRQLVERLGVDGIRFAGRVEPAALPRIYDEADIFLNSSVVDNQPVSILEAFAAGLPVVSTATGDIPAMLQRGENGLLVEAGNPSAMAAAVARLLEDSDLSAKIARRAHDAIERYTWHCAGDEWKTLYAELSPAVANREEILAHGA